MSNILLAYGNKATGATLSGGGWTTSGLPLNNLKDGRLAKVARSDGASVYQTQFRFDLAANYVLRALALVNHNLTTSANWRARTTDATLDMDFVGPTSMRPRTLTTSGGANGTRVGPYGTIEAATCPRYDFSPVNLASGTATQTISSVPAGTYLLITTGSNAAVMASGSTVSNSGTIGTTTNPAFVVVTATGNVTLTVLSAATAIHFRESLGLLVEEARDNLAQRSEALATAPWASGVIAVTNAFSSAKGLSFSRLSGGLNLGILYQDVSFTGDGTKCFSLFVKQDASASGVMSAALYDNTAGVFRGGAAITVAVDGVVTAASSVGGVILGVEPWGDGVYRVLVQAAGIIAANDNRIYASDTGGATISSVLLSGVQPENGSFPTTYIPTTSAAVTRTADSVSITGSNFSSWYTGSAGTLYIEGKYSVGASLVPNNRVMCAFYGAGSEAATVYNGSGFAGSVYVANSSGVQQFYAPGSITDDSVAKVAYSFNAGSYARCGNGATVQTGAGSAVMSTMNRIAIGAGDGGAYMGGHLRRIAFWPTERTNAELQAITTTGPDALGLDTGWQPAKQMTFHGDTPTNWGEQYPLIAAFDARTARYGTVEIDDTTNTATYVQLGQLFIAGGFQPTENAEQQGFADGRTDLSSSVKSVGGQKYGTARRRPRTVDFSFPMLTLEEGDHLDEMMAEVGTTEDVLYVPDPSDAAKTQRYGFLGTLRELSPLEYPLADKRAVPLRMEQKL